EDGIRFFHVTGVQTCALPIWRVDHPGCHCQGVLSVQKVWQAIAMDQEIIKITGLTKSYGTHTVVNNLNLSVNKGEIYGLLGPNGAGKSTTILMLMGLSEPNGGSIRVAGIDPVRQPVDVKRKVGYLPEDVGFYDERTGLDNIFYTGRLNGLSGKEAKEKAMWLLERVGLTDAANKKTGTYSRGMRQRLGLADVLMKSPEVIILDEPTLGLD